MRLASSYVYSYNSVAVMQKEILCATTKASKQGWMKAGTQCLPVASESLHAGLLARTAQAVRQQGQYTMNDKQRVRYNDAYPGGYRYDVSDLTDLASVPSFRSLKALRGRRPMSSRGDDPWIGPQAERRLTERSRARTCRKLRSDR